jgi:hypothetical protein
MSDRTVAERLEDSVLNVTKDWAKQRKAEERHASAAANRRARLIRASDYYNFRSAASEVMELAYMAASETSGGQTWMVPSDVQGCAEASRRRGL